MPSSSTPQRPKSSAATDGASEILLESLVQKAVTESDLTWSGLVVWSFRVPAIAQTSGGRGVSLLDRPPLVLSAIVGLDHHAGR